MSLVVLSFLVEVAIECRAVNVRLAIGEEKYLLVFVFAVVLHLVMTARIAVSAILSKVELVSLGAVADD